MNVPPPPPPPESGASVPPPPGVPAPPPPSSAEAQQQPQAPPEQKPADPGSFNELHGEARMTLASTRMFDGVNFTFNRGVSENMQVTHTVDLGSSQGKPGYRFAPVFVSSEKVGETPKNIMTADVNRAGNMRARIMHNLSKKLNFSVQAEAEGREQMQTDFTANYVTEGDSQLSLSLAGLKPAAKTGIFVTSFLQKVSPSFTLGGQFVAQAGGGHLNTGMSLGGRWRNDVWAFCGTVGAQGVASLSYHHKSDQTTQYATQLELNLMQGETVGTLGYQKTFGHSQVLGQLNTKGEVMVLAEQQVLGPAVLMSIAGTLNHQTGATTVGLGFTFNN